MQMSHIKYILPVLASALLSVACDNSRYDDGDEPDYPPVLPKNYYISPSCTDAMIQVSATSGKGIKSVLGSGYDVTGSFLSPSSMRQPVIDIDKMSDGAVSIFAGTASGSGEYYAGENAREFLRDIMSSMGMDVSSSNPSYGFVGTLTESGHMNDTYIMRVVWGQTSVGHFNTLKHRLYEALSDGFRTDLKELSPNELVDKYGTHIISRAKMGFAVRQLYHAYVHKEDVMSSAYDGFKATLEKLSKDGYPWQSLSRIYLNLRNFGATLSMEFCGGDPLAVRYDTVNGYVTGLDEWQASVSNENSAMILLDKDDLIPLHAAIEDETLRSAVSSVIAGHIKNVWDVCSSKASVRILFQHTDGIRYRYVSDDRLSENLTNGGMPFHGVLGAVYNREQPATAVLYSNRLSEDVYRLSLDRGEDWSIIGYVFQKPVADCIVLQEISDGSRYAYTIEEGDRFGINGEWHSTGVEFYLLRP